VCRQWYFDDFDDEEWFVALLVLVAMMSLFQIWWTTAYLYAYSQTRERLFLVQVVQGVAFAVLFIHATIAAVYQQQINGLLGSGMLIIGVVTFIIWRVRGGIKLQFQRYHRGMFDVLFFRKPAVDLKRRVRSK
jgi:Kef-type K+ transport system membrane component KefB